MGDEYHALSHTGIHVAAIIGHGKEEIHCRHCSYKAVDGDVRTLVDQPGKLPDGKSGDDTEQQHHSVRAQETGHNCYHEDDSCDSSDDKVFHIAYFSFKFFQVSLMELEVLTLGVWLLLLLTMLSRFTCVVT